MQNMTKKMTEDRKSELIESIYTSLDCYKSDRAQVDARVREDRTLWARGRTSTGEKVSTGHLFNTVSTKHAEAMDAIPTPSVYPRNSRDSEAALKLAEVLPSILAGCGFEEVYSRFWWEKLICGTAVLGVFWQSDKCRGKGDIELRVIPIERIYWDLGVSDIEDSDFVFVLRDVRASSLGAKYPHFDPKNSEKEDDYVVLIDAYYHKNGKLELCRVAEKTLLYASEEDDRLSGWYAHARYPFVVDCLYPDTIGLCGFGAVDVAKDAQYCIDDLTRSFMRNAKVASSPRYFVREDSGINEDEFCDLESDVVHVAAGQVDTDSIRPIEINSLGAVYTDLLKMKIDEIKETTGNRDWLQGGTSGGVTSGTAISALQEAGNKLGRDMQASCYRALEKMCLLCVELIRQFYTTPREIPVYTESGISHVLIHNAALGVNVEDVLASPVFDIKMEKKTGSPFSKEEANRRVIEMWNSGFFEKENAQSALLALDLMDFGGKQKLLEAIHEFNLQGRQ